MRDFTIKTQYLPESFKKHNDEISLKQALWTQIQDKLQECKKLKVASEHLDTTVVEINLGLNSYMNIDELKEIRQLNNLIEYYNIKNKIKKDKKWQN